MLRDEFVDLLMKRLGNSTDVTLRDDIIREMVLTQETALEGDIMQPWFLISELTTGATIVGDERVALPANYISPWENGFLYRYDVTLDDPYIEMDRADWDDIKEHLNYSGTPTHYDIAGDYLLMRPVADAIYPLRMRYIASEPTLAGSYGDSNNIENAWLKYASDWFLGVVGEVIAAQYLQGKAAMVQIFQRQAKLGRNRIMVRNIATQEIMKERVIGG